MRAIIFDVETTGLLMPSVANRIDQPRIIELGAVLTDGETILGEYSQLIYPGFLISEDITKITGIRREDLDGKPLFASTIPSLKEFFEGSSLLVAHNAPFDVQMLKNELDTAGVGDAFPWPPEVICTAQEYSPVFGFNPSMAQIYERALKREFVQKHRALDDCRDLCEALLSDGFFKNIGVA